MPAFRTLARFWTRVFVLFLTTVVSRILVGTLRFIEIGAGMPRTNSCEIYDNLYRASAGEAMAAGGALLRTRHPVDA